MEGPPQEALLDLSAEWKTWTGKPFVFARWAVRSALPAREKLQLGLSIRSAVELALGDLEGVAQAESRRVGLGEEDLLAYLRGIRYKLGPAELEGAAEFERRLKELAGR